MPGETEAGQEPPPLEGRDPSRPRFPYLLSGDSGRTPRVGGEGPESVSREDSARVDISSQQASTGTGFTLLPQCAVACKSLVELKKVTGADFLRFP